MNDPFCMSDIESHGDLPGDAQRLANRQAGTASAVARRIREFVRQRFAVHEL